MKAHTHPLLLEMELQLAGKITDCEFSSVRGVGITCGFFATFDLRDQSFASDLNGWV